MKCKEIEKKLSEYIDGELDICQCESIQEHIENCPHCKTLFTSFKSCIDLCSQFLKVDIPTDIQTRLRERLQNEYKKNET